MAEINNIYEHKVCVCVFLRAYGDTKLFGTRGKVSQHLLLKSKCLSQFITQLPKDACLLSTSPLYAALAYDSWTHVGTPP